MENYIIDLTTLFPGRSVTSEPMFESRDQYEEFVQRYRADVIPQLEQQAENRRRSEEEARHRFVR